MSHTSGRLAAFGEQTLVIALTVWLTLFAPLFCQFHGLLMGMHPEMIRTGHSAAMGEMLCGEVMQLPALPPASGTPLWNTHQTTPGTTLMASLYLVALPAQQDFAPLNPLRRLTLPPFLPPTEPDLPIPKQPPRL